MRMKASSLLQIQQIMIENGKAGKLSMWTVYDHPLDYPDSYVARLFEITGNGETQITENIIITPDLDLLRHIMIDDLHLTVMDRFPTDDLKIIEVWL